MGWFDEFINEQIEDAGDFFTDDMLGYLTGTDGGGAASPCCLQKQCFL